MDVNSYLMMPTAGKSLRHNFDALYYEIIYQTVKLIEPDNADSSKLLAIRNERTGEICHTFHQAISFSLDLGQELPFSLLRKFYPKTGAAEAAWFIQGTQDSTWIKKYCPIWDDFTEDDGVTIKAAYGYRWRKHFGRDQLEDLISGLFINPSDRRTVLCAWDPGDDGLMHHGTKNVPCPFAMSFYIVGDKLMMSYYIRSSDLYVGLPYDVFCTAYVVDAVISSLRQRALLHLAKPNRMYDEPTLQRLMKLSMLKPGTMSVTLGNPHMYDKHLPLAQEALTCYRNNKNSYHQSAIKTGTQLYPRMPNWSVEQIEANPDLYVETVGADFLNCIKSATPPQRPDVAV